VGKKFVAGKTYVIEGSVETVSLTVVRLSDTM